MPTKTLASKRKLGHTSAKRSNTDAFVAQTAGQAKHESEARQLRFMRIGEVCFHTGLSKTSVYAKLKEGPSFDIEFPRQVQLTSFRSSTKQKSPKNAAVGWYAHEIFEWIASRADKQERGVA